MNVLTEILKKLNKNYEELLPDEKLTFDNYERILSQGTVTADKMAQFLQAEIAKNEAALTEQDVKLNDRKDLWLKMAIQRDRQFLEFIIAPQKAAQSLEAYLKNLHKLN